MRRRLSSISWIGLALSVLLSIVANVRAADRDEDAPLVLDGLDRSTIVALLGEPDKVRKSEGGETLVYKLLTVGDDHRQAPDERLVDLPGVGRCVRRIPLPVDDYDEKIEFEPTTVTEDGRMEGGSLSQSSSASKTIHLNEPLPKTEEGNDARTGKIRLLVTLGRDGKVLAWNTKGGR